MAAEPQAMHCEPGSWCAYCHGAFTPSRLWERFCSTRCRTAYDTDIGTQGRVKGVRKVKGGVSVTLHFADGPAAERALKMTLGEPHRMVKVP